MQQHVACGMLVCIVLYCTIYREANHRAIVEVESIAPRCLCIGLKIWGLLVHLCNEGRKAVYCQQDHDHHCVLEMARG